jgi:CubicO group peptidase (beta-lactamase class C family)
LGRNHDSSASLAHIRHTGHPPDAGVSGDQNTAVAADRLLARFEDKPLVSAPGERFNYSNTGYIVFAALIERASGQAYEQFLQENILGPLDLKQTGSDTFTAIIPRRTSGYRPLPGGAQLRNADYIDMTVPIGGGSLYSTTEDLARWAQALFGDKLLSARSLEKMTRPVRSNYAYGVRVGKVSERLMYEHPGAIDGFNSAIMCFPESKTAVVVLANVNGDAPVTIANRLARMAHGEGVVLPTERTAITLAASVLGRYVGVYDAGPGQSFTIAVAGDRPQVTMPQRVTFAIFPESETKFFARDRDVQFDFIVDDRGRVTQLVNSAGIKALRKSD